MVKLESQQSKVKDLTMPDAMTSAKQTLKSTEQLFDTLPIKPKIVTVDNTNTSREDE